jgi:hypothetical protein
MSISYATTSSLFTKHVREILSSLLNALHHDIIPCTLAQFFATTHHIKCSSAHFAACACVHFATFQGSSVTASKQNLHFAALQAQSVRSFCDSSLKLSLSKPSKLPCPTFPGLRYLPTPAPTLILPQHCLLVVVCPPSQIPSEDIPSKEECRLAL